MKKKRDNTLSFLLMVALFFGLLFAMDSSVHAATLNSNSKTWAENSTITDDVTISGDVTVLANITLTLPEGKTLTVNGTINATGYTLTVSGDGTLNVSGNGTLNVSGNVSEGIDGGTGVGNSRAVSGTITASTLNIEDSDDEDTWSAVPFGSGSSKRYVRTFIPVTSVSLDKTSITLILDNNDTDTLTVIISPDNAIYKTVTWTTSSADIVSVTQTEKLRQSEQERQPLPQQLPTGQTLQAMTRQQHVP